MITNRFRSSIITGWVLAAWKQDCYSHRTTIQDIGGDKSFVDDLNIKLGIVSSRVALLLRSAEIKPVFSRFVLLNISPSMSCPESYILMTRESCHKEKMLLRLQLFRGGTDWFWGAAKIFLLRGMVAFSALFRSFFII